MLQTLANVAEVIGVIAAIVFGFVQVRQYRQQRRDAQGQPLLFEWFEWLVGQLEQRRRTEAVSAYVRFRDWRPAP
jgi:hypothetical protein